MADPEKQEPPPSSDKGQQSSGGTGGGDIELTMAYVTSIPGILRIVEFFTLMLAFALAADSKEGISVVWSWGRMDFFLFVTVTSWILVIVVFILFAFNIIAKINLNIDWNMPNLVFAVIVAILLLISSSLLADDARKLGNVRHSFIDKLRAGVAFGFITMFVFIGDAVVHFMKMQGKM